MTTELTEAETYFAYGSNLHRPDWERFCDQAGYRPDCIEPLYPAWLLDYQPIYHYYSTSRGGGVLDVAPSLGQITPGMLFRVDADGWDALDAKEGHPNFYARQTLTVLTEDGERQRAVTYLVVPKRQRAEFVAPTPEYVALVEEGLRGYELPTTAQAQAAIGEQPAPLVRHLFAYGLLQSPYAFGQSLDGIAHHQAARAPGRLFNLGAFPGWQPPIHADDWVHGELLELEYPASTLVETDAIEGYRDSDPDALYHRVLVRVETADAMPVLAWCYRYATRLSGPAIPGGRWTPVSCRSDPQYPSEVEAFSQHPGAG